MADERVIVVGAGGISHPWFGAINAEQLGVAAVVDIRKEAAAAQIEKYNLAGAIASDDLDATLRDHARGATFLIDLTIPAAHFDVTTKALRAGLHVVGEKPMAETMEQAREMIRVSEATGKLFMTSQSRRWDTNHATVASTIRAGKLGTVTGANCDFFIGAHFGGFRDEMKNVLILDMAIHHFDLARLFLGTNAKRVWCDESNPTGSWYAHGSTATCVFEMEDGVRFNYRGSWCSEGCHTSWNGDWRLVGTEGTLLYAKDKTPSGQVVADRSEKKFHLPLKDLEIVPTTIEKPAFHGGLDEMLRFIRTGQKPQTECHDNIHSLAMVHAAIKAAAEQRWVEVSEV
jgi:predicted dehydrogenase